jgi:hypothetical protein
MEKKKRLILDSASKITKETAKNVFPTELLQLGKYLKLSIIIYQAELLFDILI